MDIDPKRIATLILLIVVPLLAAFIIGDIFRFIPIETIVRIAEKHFAVVIGLPLSALLSAFIVVALKQSGGPIKFEGLGFKFDGASGQVILWVICFLSISVAIKMLWNLD